MNIELEAAQTTAWLLGELFCMAQDDSPEEQALMDASRVAESRVFDLGGELL